MLVYGGGFIKRSGVYDEVMECGACQKRKDRSDRFAKNVFSMDTAEEGVEALADFIKECGLPVKMSDLRSKVEITPEILRKVADTCNVIKCNPRELSRDEIYDILTECM